MPRKQPVVDAAGELDLPVGAPVPKLVTFDLDATLWETEMYLLDGPPFSKDKQGILRDCHGAAVELCSGSAAALHLLYEDPRFADTKVAYVSRTHYPDWANECLKQLQFAEGLFLTASRASPELNQIFPSDKKVHFGKIHKATGIPYEEMLFFDNERRNVTSVSELGVVCVYTPHGLTWDAFVRGLHAYAEAHS